MPHCTCCPSVRPSVCSVRAPNLKAKKAYAEKQKNGMNVPRDSY